MGTGTSKRMRGARILIETLIEQGVTEVFGYPGGTVLDIYDELYRARRRIRHVLTAHEQGAAHAADGYARATGKVGVVIATSGPGATNLVTGIATAMLDSVPLVAVTGNVATSMIGRDSFQEVDITGVTVPITKHNFFVQDVQSLAATVREAFAIARSGRPGPVLVDIPKDVQQALCAFEGGSFAQSEPFSPVSESELDRAAALIANAERPYIYLGGGALACGLGNDIQALAEKIDAVIGCSFMGLTAVPSNAPRFLGMQGMHGRFASTAAFGEADLILGVGVRFSDRATGEKEALEQRAKIIQMDADLAELGKNVPLDLGLHGDLREMFPRLLQRCKQKRNPTWTARVKELQKQGEALETAAPFDENELTPQAMFRAINALREPDSPVATDVGRHQMWTAQLCAFSVPHTLVSSGGLGTMGYGLGAAIGASIGTNKKTLLVTGDGSFGMDCPELATAVSERLPLVIVLCNNRTLGMVRQMQKERLSGRCAYTDLSARKTDYVKLAEAFGAKGLRAETPKQFEASLREAMTAKGPVVIDCALDPDLPAFSPFGAAQN